MINQAHPRHIIVCHHVFPALAGFTLVWLTGLIARGLGGGPFAQGLASLGTACAGVYLVLHHLFTMNALEPLNWMACAYVVIRIVKTGNQKLWLWFGVLAGIGLENKYSIALFAFSIVVGLLLTRERKALASKWIWNAGLIAFLIFLPNLVWNIRHHWPFLELMRNIRASGRDTVFTPPGYLRAQIFLMTPVTFPVWALGALYFSLWKEGKPFRRLGWACVVLLTALIVLRGKDYYAAPVYPIAFAGGAIAIERFSIGNWKWVKAVTVILILLGTLAFLPLFAPILPPEALLRYQAKLPFNLQPGEKSMQSEPMPHYFSWDFGWEQMVFAVSQAYQAVPAEERSDTAIFANDFAAAGAIDLLGPKYGLPKAISGHQTYWFWGPRSYSGRTVIMVGSTSRRAQEWFNEVTVMAELHHPYAPPWENRPVLLCRGLKRFGTSKDAWPKVKNWE